MKFETMAWKMSGAVSVIPRTAELGVKLWTRVAGEFGCGSRR